MNSFLLVLSVAFAAGTSCVHSAPLPCDIYGAAGTPCVAAHSMVRALYQQYSGPLYLVRRSSDNTTKAINTMTAGGYADSATQDTFCQGTQCDVRRIFDQSPRGNHLDTAPPGGAAHHPDNGVNASKEQLTVGGHSVYSAYFEGGMGYRNDNTSGIATGDEPETMYMVTAGKHYNGGCCFDYGNAETDAHDHGAGTMEAVYFGSSSGWGHGGGKGPWVMADLENGLWAGNEKANPNNMPIVADFVTAMVKGKAGGFTLKGGDAQKGNLTTLFDGPRPNGYNPMKKQGCIILGIGGDNSDWAIGTFYEGLMTSGYSTDAADDAVQANIVSAGYKFST
eukprot:m.338152 g.338152  ORF g.338152 m.338152 type:complete len:336 (+) comp18324_c0_seq1:140-1147(+)